MNGKTRRPSRLETGLEVVRTPQTIFDEVHGKGHPVVPHGPPDGLSGARENHQRNLSRCGGLTMDKKEEFLKIWTERVQRDYADALLAWLERETDFFEAPASTRHLGAHPGGLLEHSLNVYHRLRGIVCLETYWLLKATEDWLQPVYDVLHQRLCREKVLHGDETTLQVLHEKGKSATSKSYMWLYRTGGNAEAPIVLYDYQPNRKAENAETFLDGFSGWLHADGYQGYHRLPEQIRVVGCWAHARRKFDEALTAVPKEQQSASKPAEALCYFAKLFQMEQDFAALAVEERFAKRLEQEKPVLEALLACANRLKPQTAPKSALGKALHYLLEQWPYLEDGRLEFSNNRAERSIKPFVMGRKNFLFCNTPGGAQSSAVLYSLIETAKETGLDPYHYLLWVLERAPKLAQTADEAWAEKLVPAQAPAECRAKV